MDGFGGVASSRHGGLLGLRLGWAGGGYRPASLGVAVCDFSRVRGPVAGSGLHSTPTPAPRCGGVGSGRALMWANSERVKAPRRGEPATTTRGSLRWTARRDIKFHRPSGVAPGRAEGPLSRVSRSRRRNAGPNGCTGSRPQPRSWPPRARSRRNPRDQPCSVAVRHRAYVPVHDSNGDLPARPARGNEEMAWRRCT